MKKRMLKTILSIGTVMAFGFAIMTQCKAEPLTAQVELTVNAGDLTILVATGSSGLDLGTVLVSNSDQIKEGQFANDTFQLLDFKGAESGYYTTLSVTNLVGEASGSHVISNDNILLQAGGLHTIEGVSASDANVSIENAINTNYVSGSLTSTYINRPVTETANAGRLGKYGDALKVKVIIPAHTVADNYHATITYTLYER